MPDGRRRLLTIPQVAEEPATSEAQISALVKRGDLVAIKLGGRGQWRVERSKLGEFIQRAYEKTEQELQGRRGSESADEDYQPEEGGEG
jgi:hypothetical protein